MKCKEATACDTPTICPSDMNIVVENQCRDNILWESLREGVGRCSKGECIVGSGSVLCGQEKSIRAAIKCDFNALNNLMWGWLGI